MGLDTGKLVHSWALVFLRPEIAAALTQKLLRPSALDEAFRSGLFISGVRRTGKTTFLRHDLIPALEAEGALVIYIDLWSDAQANPAGLVHFAIREALADLSKPHSRVLKNLAKVRGADIAAMGFKFGFKLDTLGEVGGPTLALEPMWFAQHPNANEEKARAERQEFGPEHVAEITQLSQRLTPPGSGCIGFTLSTRLSRPIIP